MEAEISFETAMERLEKIVGEMESSKLPLEELLVRYAENRIETLSRPPNGRSQASSTTSAQDSPKDPNKTKNEEIRLF